VVRNFQVLGLTLIQTVKFKFPRLIKVSFRFNHYYYRNEKTKDKVDV